MFLPSAQGMEMNIDTGGFFLPLSAFDKKTYKRTFLLLHEKKSVLLWAFLNALPNARKSIGKGFQA